MKKLNYACFFCIALFLICATDGISQQIKKGKTSIPDFAPTPPMGFNSFDSYLVFLHQDEANKLIDVMAKKYLPYGYNYFVIDDGWQINADLYEGIHYPKKSLGVALDEYGLLEPSKTYFPDGMKSVIDHAHKKGLKFGLWIIRGIPRIAYEKNLPIKGTKHTARDITDTTSICVWKEQNYGVDMSKPGAQEYYNSLIDKLASWGVDFLKVDDIVEEPKEFLAVVKAIENGGHKITLSLSPGDAHSITDLAYYKKTNMLRITGDVWDNQKSIDKGFKFWEEYAGKEGNGFWLDLDMIPFGDLKVNVPDFLDKAKADKRHYSSFSKPQLQTFITQRALSASPLFVGGNMLTMDDYSYSLLINKDMLACNQNGVMGVNVYRKDSIDVWYTANKNIPGKGWVGVFNRNVDVKKVTLTKYDLGLRDFVRSYDLVENKHSFMIHDIWTNQEFKLSDKHEFLIPANGVVFMEFEEIYGGK